MSDTYGHIIHACAPNDINGNPQRIYLVLRTDGSRGVYDEGYLGSDAVPKPDRDTLNRELRIDITPKEYRNLLRAVPVRRPMPCEMCGGLPCLEGCKP